MKTQRLFTWGILGFLWLPLLQTLFGFCPPAELTGVQPEAPWPTWGWEAALHRVPQKGLEDWYGQQYGFHGYLVKTRNQILYSCFREAEGREGIVVGKGGRLLSEPYILSSLQYDPPLDFTAVAERLAGLERSMKARGKALVVLVTPSKSSLELDAIPDAYWRFPHGTPGANYENFVRALRKAGVPLVDGRRIVESAAATLAVAPFPKTGIHWNQEASGLAAQALLECLDRETGKDIGSIREARVEHQGPPRGSDDDYAQLLNLWDYPMDEKGTVVQWTGRTGPERGRLTGIFEGGSFNGMVLDHFARLAAFKDVIDIVYNARYLDAAEPRAGLRDLRDLDMDRALAGADFVVLEVNESLLVASDPDVFFNGFLKTLGKWLRPGV